MPDKLSRLNRRRDRRLKLRRLKYRMEVDHPPRRKFMEHNSGKDNGEGRFWNGPTEQELISEIRMREEIEDLGHDPEWWKYEDGMIGEETADEAYQRQYWEDIENGLFDDPYEYDLYPDPWDGSDDDLRTPDDVDDDDDRAYFERAFADFDYG